MTGLDWMHETRDIGDRGLAIERQASAEERAELARWLGVASVERVDARYRIKPLGESRYRLTGTLDAALTQACVVSLEPVPASLHEELDVELGPAETNPSLAEDEHEVLALPDWEPIVDGRIEAGRIFADTLAAALDPYPRKAGASFDWQDPKIAEGGGAFAALAKLKKGD